MSGLPTSRDLRYTNSMLRIVFALSLAGAILSAADKKPSDLTLRDLSGKKVQLRDHRGRIVVLNFWATSCGPCREEMPMLVRPPRRGRRKALRSSPSRSTMTRQRRTLRPSLSAIMSNFRCGAALRQTTLTSFAWEKAFRTPHFWTRAEWCYRAWSVKSTARSWMNGSYG
jgi:thiol-disulfide isomerase/thioredoxin